MVEWRISAVVVGAAIALSLYLFHGDGFNPGEYFRLSYAYCSFSAVIGQIMVI